MNTERLLERFLSYVRVDTTANDQTDDYPSSSGQFELGKVILAELESLGLEQVSQDENGLIHATIPGNQPGAPRIAFNAHLDTSPETTGANVQPQVVRDYDGKDITLSGTPDRPLSVDDNAELAEMVGKTLITTDGTTLLGGDDKAGLAIIMELAADLAENPDIAHGDVRILFTCDEEIGRGVKHVDVAGLNAVACYTLDGPGHGQIDIETFSADMATIKFKGVNIHPAIAKDRMVNAIRAAGDFLVRLPAELSPERTSGRAGFLHPYQISGGVAEVECRVLLRDFDSDKLAEYADLLRQVAAVVERENAGVEVEVIVEKQYRNMAEGLKGEPRAVAYAVKAFQQLGIEPEQQIIRGGTDGSQLTELGLPTPNLSSGQHNIHSPLEFACLDEMEAAVKVLVELVQVWAADEGVPT